MVLEVERYRDARSITSSTAVSADVTELLRVNAAILSSIWMELACPDQPDMIVNHMDRLILSLSTPRGVQLARLSYGLWLKSKGGEGRIASRSHLECSRTSRDCKIAEESRRAIEYINISMERKSEMVVHDAYPRGADTPSTVVASEKEAVALAIGGISTPPPSTILTQVVAVPHGICVICMVAPRNIIITPCYHMACCMPCFETWARTNPHDVKCPICRTSVLSHHRVYF